MKKWNISIPLGGMRVGDSFFIPCLDQRKVHSHVRKCAEEFNIGVTVKNVTEDYIKGVRTWRIR